LIYDRVIWLKTYDPETSAIYALNDIVVKVPPQGCDARRSGEIRAELELDGKIHGFSDLSRSRNCSAIQSMNTRRRGESWRVWE